MSKGAYKSPVCAGCKQTTTTLYSIDTGSADLVKAISVAVRLKGKNAVHMRKEMEVGKKEWSYERLLNEGKITSSMTQNSIRPHKHGLIAKVRGETGVWCLTTKGARFLRGERIAKYAIQDKATKHIVGYWEPEKYTVTIGELHRKNTPYWEGAGYDIVDGEIRVEKPGEQAKGLFN